MEKKARTSNHKVHVLVKGMHCASCAANITKHLTKTKGVTSANVNFSTEKALVEFDKDIVSEDKLLGVIKKAGYGAEIVTDVAHEHQKLEKTYKVAREKAPSALLIANIGGVQLVHGCSLKEVKAAVEMIDADALAVHLNAVQEALQPEGQTNFKGILAKIAEVAGELDVPVIVKETGCGIAAEDAISAAQDRSVTGCDGCRCR